MYHFHSYCNDFLLICSASRARLGYAAVTSNPRIAGVSSSEVLFLAHAV
jgi:hypothetical protein